MSPLAHAIQQISPVAVKTAYSPCISSLKVCLAREGSAVLRKLLTGFLLMSTLALVACDDAPEETETKAQSDSGIFQAAKLEKDQNIASPGKGIVRTRLVGLDQKNDGLTALLKSVSDKPDADNNSTSTPSHRLTLNLFPDVVVTVSLEASPGGAGLPEFFGGTVVGDPTSLVTLMHRDGTFSGNVRYGGKLFRIRSAGIDQYSIEEVAPVSLPAHKSSDE
jgi:hypothetical protein